MITRPSGDIQTSILISQEFYNLCKEHKIKLTEAERVGVSVLLAEKDLIPYDNNLNLYRKMNLFKEKAEEALQKLAEIENKHV